MQLGGCLLRVFVPPGPSQAQRIHLNTFKGAVWREGVLITYGSSVS